MLHLAIAILGILLTIFFVVGVHEFGHFIVARLVGVKVLRFSIGFGKTLIRWYGKNGTEYVFAALPLGGYVKMLDETEGEVAPEELNQAYNQQPFYKKLAIVSAGPLFNLIFAFLLYWFVFMIGFTNLIPLIGNVTPDSIAAHAGVKPNQEIVRIGEKNTHSWMSVIIGLLSYAGENQSLSMTTQNLNTKQTITYQLNLANWHLDNLKPDPLSSLGITPYEPNVPLVIGGFSKYSTAQSQLKIGDKILEIKNQPIKDWVQLTDVIDKNPDATLSFKIVRGGKNIIVPVKIGYKRGLLFDKHGFIGILPAFKWPENLLQHNQYGPIAALSRAWDDTKDFTYLNIVVFGKLLVGKVSLQSLGGPITIFQSAGSALNQGIVPFLSFLAFLSISIGLINILPIPGLDGGHIFIQFIEFIIRRPISMRIQVLFYRLGLIILLLLIAQALLNDILRL